MTPPMIPQCPHCLNHHAGKCSYTPVSRAEFDKLRADVTTIAEYLGGLVTMHSPTQGDMRRIAEGRDA